MANELEQLVLKKAQSWLDGHYDEATKKQVKYLMDNDMKELVESFYKDLEFGTGDVGGNVVIRAHPDALLLYETSAAELRDVDTVEALAAVQEDRQI